MSALTVGTVFEDGGPVTTRVGDLLRWAAASGDLSPIHFDADVAHGRGFPGPIVHGTWKAAVLRGFLGQWLGEGTKVQSLTVEYIRPDLVGAVLRFGGEVTDISPRTDGELDVACRLWVRAADGQTTLDGHCVAAVPAVTEDGLPLARLRSALKVGEVAGVFHYRVEPADVEAFSNALRAPLPLGGLAPPTYYAALDPVERRDLDLDGFLQTLSLEMTGGGNAFNEVRYERPFRIDEELEVTTRYTEVYEKAGSRGTLLFRVRENEFRDGAGSLVATSRCGHVLSFSLPEATDVNG